jgi:hypothetical protein
VSSKLTIRAKRADTNLLVGETPTIVKEDISGQEEEVLAQLKEVKVVHFCRAQ